MCNCCNGTKNEFVYANMKCSMSIKDGEMRICLPWNAVHVPVKYCPMCGRKLQDTVDAIEADESVFDMMKDAIESGMS